MLPFPRTLRCSDLSCVFFRFACLCVGWIIHAHDALHKKKGGLNCCLKIRRHDIPAWCLGMVLIPVSLLMYHLLLRQAYLTNFPAILFALGVTLLFSCISLKRSPRFLCWSGGAGLFFLYIFQRIPMMIGARAGWNADSPFFYQLFCVVVTLGIAWCTSRVFPWLIRFVIPSK